MAKLQKANVDNVSGYLSDVSYLIANAPLEDLKLIGELLVDAYQTDRQVFIMGNGGSASTASHFACDLQKSIGLYGEKKFRVMALTDSVPIMTAWANDFDYSDIFTQQLATWLQPNDLVIGISGSGNSENIVKAMELAEEKGAVTVSLTGFNGGRVGRMVQYNVLVDSDDMQHIEDVHVIFTHLLFRYVLDNVLSTDKLIFHAA